MAYMDRAKILTDMAQGLMRRVYLLNSLFQSSEKPAFLSDPEMQKIRQRLDKSFPDVGDLSKTPGVEAFQASTSKIIENLSEFEDVIVGVVDFARVAEPLLQEIPRELLDIRIERSQSVITVYFDLLLSYMRVMMLMSAIADRKSIFALYSAAYSAANQGKRCAAWNDACILFPILENLQRFFIDSFASVAPLLKPLLLQLKGSLQFSTSIAAVDQMRAQYTLNPALEGAQAILPSNATITRTSTLSAYEEILNTDKYHDYVLFTHLACPSLLFSPDSLMLFDMSASNILFLGIFRDLSLSIHDEFDTLSQQFPGPNDSVSIPKGFKFKTTLRDIAKRATKEAAHRMRYRRSYISAELQNIKGVLLASPGLLAPKFPLVVAAAAFAKAEIIAYFRHLDQQAAVRKDCRKYYFAEEFVGGDITALMFELAAVSNFVKQHANIVREYYAEYLSVNDVKALGPLVAKCSDYIPAFKPVLDAIVSSLRSLKVEDIGACLPEVLEADFVRNTSTISYSDMFPSLASVRVNWDRLLAMLSSGKYGKGTESEFDAISARMRGVVFRTKFVDGLGDLSQIYFEPYECWWFRSHSWRAFYAAFSYSGSALYPQQSLVHFREIQNIELNIHDDCKYEKFLLVRIAVKTTDSMIEAFVVHVLRQVQSLWDYLGVLDGQTLPIEAGRRIERNQSARRKDPNAVVEPLPGFESEGGDCRKTISRFTAVRSNLSQLLAACHHFGCFRVGNREYNLSALLRVRISAYLEQNMHKLFMDNSTRDEVTFRPAISTLKFTAGCRAIQIALGFLGCNYQHTLRSLLFRECIDTTIFPPGNVLPLTLGGSTGVLSGESSQSLVSRLANWYTNLVDYIASPASGIVWSPSKKAFVLWSNGVGGSGTGLSSPSSSSSSSIVNFLAAEDLKQLCTLIGPQGVRTIDARILNLIATKVTGVFSFIEEHRGLLTELQASFGINIRSALRLKAASELEALLTSIGTALCLREILHVGLGNSIQILNPNLPEIIASIAKTLLPYAQPTLCAPIYTLLGDLGAVARPDLALVSSLSPHIHAEEEIRAGDASTSGSQSSLTKRDDINLFPVACAALLASEKWDSASFQLDLEAFEHNEHVAMVAAANLMVAFSITDDSPPGSTYKPETPVSKMCEGFVRIAAQILLTLRSVEKSSYPSRPLRAMGTLLDNFLTALPTGLLSKSDVEKYYPYSLQMSSVMDVALGRARDTDVLKAFSHFDVQPQQAPAPAAGGAIKTSSATDAAVV